MIKPILIILIILSAASGYTQKPGGLYGHKTDSLQNLITNNKEGDIVKITLLHDLARTCFYNLAFKRGAESLRTAQQLSKKINYPNGEALYLRTMAALLVQTPPGLYYEYHAKWLFRELKLKDDFDDLHLSFSALIKSEGKNFAQNHAAQLQEGLAYAESIRDDELIAAFL